MYTCVCGIQHSGIFLAAPYYYYYYNTCGCIVRPHAHVLLCTYTQRLSRTVSLLRLFYSCTNGVRTRSNKKMILSHTLIHSYVHLYHSPFPLPSSHPGSLATTPAAVETGTYLRAGAPVLLQGTVCQESEGPSHNIMCKV